ncbi:MAG: DUF2953 domain-containing protein [Clostridiales bacterium]|nr:DUF2953 domain-containing protein [Clostridiales bacterium]
MIFIIFKIIGIVLGILLALFLFLVGIILFVPVRYRVYASKYDTIQVKARVSWLLRIVSLRFRYYSEEETYWYCLRIFGFTFIDSNRPTNAKKVKKVKVKKTKSDKRKDKKTKVKKTKKVIASDKVLGIDDQIDSKDKTIEDNDILYDEIQEDKKDIIKPLQNEHTNIVGNIEEIEEEREEKEAFFYRITKPIRTIFQRIKDIFIKIREGLHSIRNIFSNIKAKIHLIKEFLDIEDNRKGIGRVYTGLKKTLRHILPYKVKGVVRIGLDDPCSTGYLLGALSMVYPIYADKIQIIPDFQEEVLEGQVDAKGRIRAFTLLIIGIKLILNDNFKTLLKNVKELKEEL